MELTMEEIYRRWYDRTLVLSMVFRLTNPKLSRIPVLVKNKIHNLSYSGISKMEVVSSIPDGYGTVTLSKDYEVRLKKINQNKIKRRNKCVDIPTILYNIGQHFTDKFRLNPNSIEDFYININGVCIHPCHLDIWDRKEEFKLKRMYNLLDISYITGIVNQDFKHRNIPLKDYLEFKDSFKSPGIFGYITHNTEFFSFPIRLYFISSPKDNSVKCKRVPVLPINQLF